MASFSESDSVLFNVFEAIKADEAVRVTPGKPPAEESVKKDELAKDP